jgi:replicative DNA helicase
MSYGRIIEELRGIGDERNMAIEVPHQANRGGESAKIIQAHHAAEDISIVATADLVLTYNATAEEKRKGLARLFVSNARNDEDRFTIFITQNYGTGQFVLQSAPDRGQDWHGLVAALPLENHIPEGTQEGELS